MKDQETNLNSAEGKPADGVASQEEADVKKLTAELDDLRQALLRHQADFANFRKRAEKERNEAGQRATARVIEGLIPVVDGFEHAASAGRTTGGPTWPTVRSSSSSGHGPRGDHRAARWHGAGGLSARICLSWTRSSPCHGAGSGCSGRRIQSRSELVIHSFPTESHRLHVQIATA